MGAEIGTCMPVLCELETGIPDLRDPDYFRRLLFRFLGKIEIWHLDARTARLYGGISNQLRRRGCVWSQVDMMQAALVQQFDLTLLTSDRDFEALPDLPTENWLEM